MSVRVCVLGSGSKGNCTLLATDKTRLLVDAGLSCKETYARLATIGEPADGLDAVVVSHEHTDHINGLRVLALDGKLPIYISAPTRDAVSWDTRIQSFEHFAASEKFTIGDIEVTPFPIPHDAADPVAFTFDTQGIRISVVTDLGYVPEVVKQRVKGCHCLIFEPRPGYAEDRPLSLVREATRDEPARAPFKQRHSRLPHRRFRWHGAGLGAGPLERNK
jgi:phosphoribosyl 1,2-cyclic phosphodiesterase